MKYVLIRYQRKSKFHGKLYYPFLTSLQGGKLSVIQRQSRELLINSSKGLDIFAAHVRLIVRGLGLGGGLESTLNLLKALMGFLNLRFNRAS